jgi:hypothetical protein
MAGDCPDDTGNLATLAFKQLNIGAKHALMA